MDLLACQCIVIKIGSALLVNEARRTLDHAWMESLINDVVHLVEKGIKVVLVSSGAMACGRFALEVSHKSLSLDSKQAIAAVGQIQLMHDYQVLLQQHQLKAAQVLLTLSDTENRAHYINLRNTISKLLEMGVIPIINENDSVATAEIRYGDNDRLAARVAQLVDADALVLLSDIDGLYDDDPKSSLDATLIPLVSSLTPQIISMAKDSKTHYGSGGMKTKLEAANIAMNSGCHMLICLGKNQNPIQQYLSTKRGTWFKSQTTHKSAKKVWLEQHLQPSGAIILDAGAVNALQQGSSLLPVGIVCVEGDFPKGAVLRIMGDSQHEIARGMVNYSSNDLKQIIGKNSKDFADILGYYGCHEAVHRDNLVMI